MSFITLALFASSLAVKPDGAPLRSGCDSKYDVVATLPPGTSVDVRFALTGTSETCYKVWATYDGKPIQGYLPASALQGLESFENERVNARTISVSNLPENTNTAIGSASPQAGEAGESQAVSADNPLVQVSTLIEKKQPRAALEAAEQNIKAYGRDYHSLLLAGIAAYQSDDPARALDYLRQAQQFRQDKLVDQWIAKIEKESAGDRSNEKLYGTRFLLRYEGGTLNPEVAHTMVATLEQEFSRVAAELGCRTDERIVTVVQSRSAYLASTGAQEWTGGVYDGTKIRVPIAANANVTPQIRRAFAHELVHACLAQMGPWPAWLHEGVAQRLSGDSVKSDELALVKAAVRDGRIPTLTKLSDSWGKMDAKHADLAYAYSLAATNLMFERYRAYGIQNVLRNPERLPGIASDLERLLLE
jgi:hypothetical protein